MPAVGDADRNIFAFYEAPPPTPKPVYVPTPTPTPTPPVMVSSLIADRLVYAGTPVRLQLAGERRQVHARGAHLILDGRDLPTRFINSQQLFATVSQTLIKNAGVRQVMARSADGKLYSNTITLNISQPTRRPNFTYVGIIGKPRFNDTAVLQDKGNKEFVRVHSAAIPVGDAFAWSAFLRKRWF